MEKVGFERYGIKLSLALEIQYLSDMVLLTIP
jgi:hypothetical protein